MPNMEAITLIDLVGHRLCAFTKNVGLDRVYKWNGQFVKAIDKYPTNRKWWTLLERNVDSTL